MTLLVEIYRRYPDPDGPICPNCDAATVARKSERPIKKAVGNFA